MKFLKEVKESLLFFHSFVKSPSVIGAFLPCSSSTADKITCRIERVSEQEPKVYLEVGAGTGVFTHKIIAKLKASDRLDVVEYNEDMCRILKSKFGKLKNVTIHQQCILSFSPEKKYDAIISGLPFNSFHSTFVDATLQKYQELLKKEGHLSYFEYMGVGKIKPLFLNKSDRQDFRKNTQLKKALSKTCSVSSDRAWWNIPPARVIHCKLPS